MRDELLLLGRLIVVCQATQQRSYGEPRSSALSLVVCPSSRFLWFNVRCQLSLDMSCLGATV